VTETLSFDITGDSGKAERAFTRTADTAVLAARGARTCALALDQQRKAADSSVGATLALAKADKILADAEKSLSGEASKTTRELDRTAASAKRLTTGGGAGGGSGGGEGGLLGGIAGGAGPGILGISAKRLSILAGVGSALGALPALTAIGAVPALAGAGGSLIGAGAKTLIGDKNNKGPLFAQAQQVAKTFQSVFKSAAAGLEQPLKQAMTAVIPLLKSLGPILKQTFAGAGTLLQPVLKGLGALAKTVLPPLGQAFRVIGPLLGIALHGFAQLAGPLLSGLVVLLKAARPAFAALAQVLGTIGTNVGNLFRSFAPVIRQSATIFTALGDVVAGLLPVVGKLAGVFARTLAPVFVVLAGVVKSLEPVLVIIGKVIADLAKAVLGDLSAAFGAVASLIKDISPALAILAKAFKGVFDVLENTGVFAILGDALEAVAPLIAKLVTALVSGLAPILPPVIKLVSALSGIAINLLTTGLKILIPIAIQLVNDVFKPLLPALNAVLPVVTAIAQAFGTGLGTVLRVIAPILAKLAPYILAVVAAIKAWAIIQGVLDIALDANPIGLIALAIAGLITGITLLVTHWKTVWGAIRTVGLDAWHWLYGNVIRPLITFFTKTIPTAFDIFKNAVAIAWDGIKLTFLKGVSFVVGLMAKLPGPLGAPFKAAQKSINTTLANTEADIRRHVANIQHDWDKLHGEKVTFTFSTQFIASHGGAVNVGGKFGYAAGTHGAAPGWAWVGERGPELMKFKGGETVIPNHAFRGYAGGAWNITDLFRPGGAAFDRQLERGFANATARYVANFLAKAGTGLGGGIPPGGGPVGGSAGAIQRLARRIFPWPASQWPAYNAVEMREAGYSLTATNPTSGAYGLAQFINGPSEYFQYGGSPFTAMGQLVGMFNYIRQRYGTPSAAWGHEVNFGWYDHGGRLRPGLTLAYNGTGRDEYVGGGAPRVVLEIRGVGGGKLDRAFTDWLTESVRIKGGGNVQVAFGRDY
jgi:phage-related protein